MKERIIGLLVCPACNRKLSLQVFLKKDGEVKEGLLECSCGQWFPIMNFVPRLLLGEYRGGYGKFLRRYSLKHFEDRIQGASHSDSSKIQVQKSFGSKWTSQPSWGTTGETKKFMKEWKMKKYGWVDRRNFKRSLENRKRILDAGTGLGREAMDFCEACRDGEVFGVDLSEAVDIAYLNTRKYSNIHIIQADLMRLPFKKKTFDFIFSEGVLHHTPDTKKAFRALLNFLAPEGEIAIYVYKKKGPIREFCDDYIREFTTKLSDKECWEFSRKMTHLGKALSDLHIEFKVPEDIPVVEMKAGKYNLQRFFYYHIFKCFWNDRFTFDENNLINFDWYHPANAHRHTAREVKAWFQKARLRFMRFDVSESGITVRGTKS
jgi:SAM-dependent methyltransferase/uncharacterized protein YbaR (Trm112 family)